ncbi:MAG: bacteriohemerythrin [Sedimenticola sp.]
MNKKQSALIWTMVLGLLIVAAGLSFLFGFDNPVSWVLLALLLMVPLVYRKIREKDQVVWNDAYSVGVAALDEDHKELIRLLDKFQTAYDYHTGDEFERATLDELVTYTKNHFAHEEGVMEEHGYPAFEEHKAKHREMALQVEGFLQDYEKRGHEALGELSSFLFRWLIEHIEGTDKEYTQFLNDKGVF